MKYEIIADSGVLTIKFEGALNFSVNESFQNLIYYLLRRNPIRVVFDFANVPSIDSVGLGLLYIAHEDLSGIGCQASIIHPEESVLRLLKLTQADCLFNVAI